MPGFSQIGSTTKTTFLNTMEDTINIQFQTAADVKKGQPVKLTAAGLVTPFVGGTDNARLLIGYALSTVASGGLVTITTPGTAVIFATVGGAVAAGPVVYSSYNGTLGYNLYAAADPAHYELSAGFALDQATATDQIIRVLV